jgi:histidinol-phosphatase (PHP family)
MTNIIYETSNENTMIDYHIHPDYSIDAEGSIDDFCQAAIQTGLREIAFTTHIDTDPLTNDCIVNVRGKEVDVRSKTWLEDYESSIRKAGEKHADEGLVVLMGAELDIYPDVAYNLPEGFLSTDWDLVIGSVHLIDHLAISKKEDAAVIYSRYNASELGNLYFSILRDTVQTSPVNVLGHIDLYRRFGEQAYGDEIYELWKPHILELASKMNRYGVGFEINTSSWRKGQSEPHPSLEIINALTSNGVRVVTIGSDSHRPEDVGYGTKRAAQVLWDCCNLQPSTFRNGKVNGTMEIVG